MREQTLRPLDAGNKKNIYGFSVQSNRPYGGGKGEGRE